MTTMSQQEVVMVAERAVTQSANDLRGEIGIKFQEIENGVKSEISVIRGELGVKFNEIENGKGGLKSIGMKLGEMESEIENLNDNVTEAFKKNNALLRNEIQALKGDLSEEF